MNFKKIVVGMLLFVVGLSAGLSGVNVAHADSACFGDYLSFLYNVRMEDTEREYFKDFFTLSNCQLNDIMEIYDQMEDVREQYRAAASNCQNTNSYKSTYRELLMEAYFIKSLVKRETGVLQESDAEKIEAERDRILESMYDDMQRIFVLEATSEGGVSQGTFDDSFDIFTERYWNKVGSYIRCEEGIWWELENSWNNFTETLAEARDAIEQIFEKDEDPYAIDEEAGGEEEEGFWGKHFKSAVSGWAYFKKDKEQRLLDADPELTVSDVVSNPNVNTLEGALEALMDSSDDYGVSENSADRMAKYKALYGTGGSLAVSGLQEILSRTGDVIDQSNQHLIDIERKAGQVLDKQCGE